MNSAPRITRLILTDFRSYPLLDLSSPALIVALVGENGAGKTNLLEALSLLGPGRGLRRAAPDDLIRTGAPGLAIAADISGGGHDTGIGGDIATTRLGLGLRRGADGALVRTARIDGATVGSSQAFAEYLRVVWLTPDQDGLFRGPAGDRRRFLDRLTLSLDAAHGTRSNELERALRTRNRLLENPQVDRLWLDSVEREVAELGVAVAMARAETVARLGAAIAAARDDASPFPWAQVALSGTIDTLVAEGPAIAAEEAYRRLLRDNRALDRAAGRTLIGPQASDFAVRHGPKDIAADQCSTGEQKALLVGLVLAHARLVGAMTGLAPLMLLDEAAAHLDPRRRAALFTELTEIGSQVWISGADPAAFGDLPEGAARFMVTPGRADGMS